MNCKKIIAAMLAFAVTSSVSAYAADVSTTTIYNGESGKVEIKTSVSGAQTDSEITYIVKSSGEIVYIDQETAADGSVEFTYKISKDKIADDYSTSVKFGSSEQTAVFSGSGTESLGIRALPQSADNSGYTIAYAGSEKAWGYGEKVTATVVPDDGYEVTAIYVNDIRQDVLTNTVELKYGDSITADVQAVVVTPGLNYVALDPFNENDGAYAGLISRTIILQPVGNLGKVGVMYNGDFYESLGGAQKQTAVRIIFPSDTKDYNLVPAYTLPDSEEIITVSVNNQ